MATFNEFQRELQKRGIAPENAYIFTLIYERLIDMSKRLDDQAKAMLALANTMSNIVTMNEETNKKVRDIQRGRDTELMQSVYPDPEDKKN